MNRCPVCGAKTQQKMVTHPHWYKGRVIIFDNVPAEVCRQCGEVLLHPDVVEKMQELVWSETTPKRTVRVPVYDLAKAK